MKYVAVSCVLLLAGCGSADPSRPQAQCEREAYNDPAVKDIIAKGASGSGELQNIAPIREAEAVKAATNRCLAVKGVIRGGGVEKRRTE